MNEFNTYENLAKTYDTSWSGFFGLSGSSKNIQSNKLKDAPQSIFFGNFSVTYLSRSRSSPSCSTASTTSTPSTSSSEGASLPTHIGSAFRAAIVSKYGDSVAAAMDTQFSLSTATQLSEKQISKIIKAVSSPTLPARLNQGTWSIINKTISSADSGLQGDYHSAMVATTEILSSSYEADGVKGVCSRDYKNEKHSINAWSDTLKSADGRTLFACARSGVMAVLDPIKQESTFDARLNENILTALYARGKLPTEGNNENNPIQLSLVDIGLVSNYEWSLGEGKIQTAQFDLVSKANGKMRSISYTPPGATESITIHVMPQIRAVNIGTQVGDSLYNPNQAQSDAAIKLIFKEVETKLPHMEKAAAQLWTWSDKPDQSMLDSDNPSNLIDQGIGDSKESNALLLAYLSELKTAPPANSESLKQAFQRKSLELRVTKELHAQCEEMQSQRIYDTENEGDYCAFHARFNLLCYKTDITPMDHCKSGNNRTSRAVEETKFLAAEIDDKITTRLQANKDPSPVKKISQLVPTSGKLSAERQKTGAAFFLGMGTQEMQKVNSGREGSREYHNVAKRIPLHPDTIQKYRGVYSSLKLRYTVSNF